jgi:hypothetical protein
VIVIEGEIGKTGKIGTTMKASSGRTTSVITGLPNESGLIRRKRTTISLVGRKT